MLIQYNYTILSPEKYVIFTLFIKDGVDEIVTLFSNSESKILPLVLLGEMLQINSDMMNELRCHPDYHGKYLELKEAFQMNVSFL